MKIRGLDWIKGQIALSTEPILKHRHYLTISAPLVWYQKRALSDLVEHCGTPDLALL